MAELAVLRCLATGLSRREIGARLYISLNTVKTHIRELYRKLGATSRADAVARAEALGLLDLTRITRVILRPQPPKPRPPSGKLRDSAGLYRELPIPLARRAKWLSKQVPQNKPQRTTTATPRTMSAAMVGSLLPARCC